MAAYAMLKFVVALSKWLWLRGRPWHERKVKREKPTGAAILAVARIIGEITLLKLLTAITRPYGR